MIFIYKKTVLEYEAKNRSGRDVKILNALIKDYLDELIVILLKNECTVTLNETECCYGDGFISETVKEEYACQDLPRFWCWYDERQRSS